MVLNQISFAFQASLFHNSCGGWISRKAEGGDACDSRLFGSKLDKVPNSFCAESFPPVFDTDPVACQGLLHSSLSSMQYLLLFMNPYCRGKKRSLNRIQPLERLSRRPHAILKIGKVRRTQ